MGGADFFVFSLFLSVSPLGQDVSSLRFGAASAILFPMCTQWCTYGRPRQAQEEAHSRSPHTTPQKGMNTGEQTSSVGEERDGGGV